MTEQPFSGLYAHLYDLFYADKDTELEVDVVEDLIRRYLPGKSQKRILDAGCGTGRHAIRLNALGHSVSGRDASMEMIEHAKQKAPEMDFRVGDIREMHALRKFQVGLMMFNVISYFSKDEDLDAVANSWSRVLCNRGLLIFDWWNIDKVLKYPPELSVKVYKSADYGVVRREVYPTLHAESHTLDIEYLITVGRVVGHSRHHLRYFSLEELAKILKTRGFEHLETFSPPYEGIEESVWTQVSAFRKNQSILGSPLSVTKTRQKNEVGYLVNSLES